MITNDPYFSIWSMTDRLADDATRHWTKHKQPLISPIRVDGKCYRLMGSEPESVSALPQQSVEVTPTRSIYRFAGAGVKVTLTFLLPLFEDDIEVLSRTASYISWDLESADGEPHSVEVFDSMGSEAAVNTPDQYIDWARESYGSLTALRVGSQDRF
ncbi:MAG: DUF4964 domain-containing protein [Acidobacteriota bacterium]|nr:DUF4964 domain-containing protein [Acidobacteriota bacterium]